MSKYYKLSTLLAKQKWCPEGISPLFYSAQMVTFVSFHEILEPRKFALRSSPTAASNFGLIE